MQLLFSSGVIRATHQATDQYLNPFIDKAQKRSGHFLPAQWLISFVSQSVSFSLFSQQSDATNPRFPPVSCSASVDHCTGWHASLEQIFCKASSPSEVPRIKSWPPNAACSTCYFATCWATVLTEMDSAVKQKAGSPGWKQWDLLTFYIQKKKSP